jgi:hypothetical protein
MADFFYTLEWNSTFEREFQFKELPAFGIGYRNRINYRGEHNTFWDSSDFLIQSTTTRLTTKDFVLNNWSSNKETKHLLLTNISSHYLKIKYFIHTSPPTLPPYNYGFLILLFFLVSKFELKILYINKVG